MRTVITAAQMFTAQGEIAHPFVVIEDEIIAQIGDSAAETLPAGEIFDFPGATILPALFDVHIHGSAGHDVMEGTPQALDAIGGFLGRHGVGAYLATTVTADIDVTLRSLEKLALEMRRPHSGAQPVGIHLEGPFLSPHKRGAHPASLLQQPSEHLLNAMWQAAEGHVRLLTIAPELPGADATIARAAALGICVSLGHSNATLAEARRGIALGAASATHTFNAMRAFDHRDPGLVGEVLTNDGLFAEIICDGLHVDPTAVRLFWKMKGRERGILITDAMSAAGMPDGHYKLGELDVRVEGGRCLIEENTIAGSTLTLDKGLRNFAEFTGAPLSQVVPLATRNPARMLGLDDRIGDIAHGRSANLVLLSPERTVIQSFLRGKPQIAV
jgi:N-acetylglucosamine-6-phosphate deacetylase